jgi:adenine-specific DNA-methyltransferase
LAQKDQLRFKDTGRGTLLDQNGQPSKWNVYTVKSNLDSDMRPRDYIFGLTNSAGTAELNALGLEGLFDNPKPTELIQFLISIVQDTSDAIVLDFFAGSGTTGHAVMALNAIDGGTRQVIQVQLPEPTSEDSDARREGYLTISDVTRKRLNAAGDSLQSTLSGQAVDVGYRSYRLSDTNFSKWRVESGIAANKLEEHLLSLRDSFSENRSSDALLIEILLKQGYSLSEKFRDINVDNLQIKSISDNIILAYLDTAIKPTLMQIRKILDLKPMRFIILDDSLQGDDELKTNLVQECKSSNVELWTA